MGALSFAIEARDGAARAGRLTTSHGELRTPVFFPVGTYGAVRGITAEELSAVGAQSVLANTYHLHLRPGEERIAVLGGLHGFMGWRGPILTDSGGFQIFSLNAHCERTESGVEFSDPVDGAKHFLSPERSIEIQEKLGADLIVVLDEFEHANDPDAGRARELMERTLRWAERGRDTVTRSDQWLFGIVQGGGFADLRAESAEKTADLGFSAFAIGGLGVGESEVERGALVDAAIAPLPDECPRYLMGLGTPDDLIDAVTRGVDVFDCVVPTRHGRHGSAFVGTGHFNLRNARFRDDAAPLDAHCTCPACRQYSRAYLHHLLKAGDSLASRLLSLHNLAYYMRLMDELREAVGAGALSAWIEARRALR